MPTILIAEDNSASRELMREILLANGYNVVEAADGEEAIALLSRQPDLLLLDIRMPKQDGFAVLKAVRQHPVMARAPIFAVTAFAMEGDREQALAAGFDQYISKPISRKELLAKIGDILRPKQQNGP